MITIFQPGMATPVAECDLKAQKGGYLVVRVVDGTGRYRRVKFPVVERQGVRGIEAEEMAVAALLPGFRRLGAQEGPSREPSPREKGGKKDKLQLTLGKTERSISQVGHEERRGRITPTLAHTESGAMDLNARVLARILRKLVEIPLYLDTPLELAVAEPLFHEMALPPLPEGRMFLSPTPGLVLETPPLLGRVDLGTTAATVRLALRGQAPVHLPQGALLGVLEVRSASELPEGMREKVFQSHFQSRFQEAVACGSS